MTGDNCICKFLQRSVGGGLSVTETILKTEVFENDDVLSFSAARDCCQFKFLRRSVDGKHLILFRSEHSLFKFLHRSVDGA